MDAVMQLQFHTSSTMMQPIGTVMHPFLENGFRTSRSRLAPLWFSVVQMTLADCSTSRFIRPSSAAFISCVQVLTNNSRTYTDYQLVTHCICLCLISPMYSENKVQCVLLTTAIVSSPLSLLSLLLSHSMKCQEKI